MLTLAVLRCCEFTVGGMGMATASSQAASTAGEMP